MARRENLRPAEFQTIGWQGLLLRVPEAWNCSIYQGTFKQGMVVLSDLRTAQLEVQWRTLRPRKLRRAMRKLQAGLTRNGHRVTPLSAVAGAFAVRAQGKPAMVLLQTSARLVEITFPDRPAYLEKIAASVVDQAGLEWQYWGLYNFFVWTPRRWLLKKTKLTPGAASLDFSRRRRILAAGSWSMADRLLAGGRLRDWAEGGVSWVRAFNRQKKARGSWAQCPPGEVFTVNYKRLGRRRVQRLYLWHDEMRNSIAWLHVAGGVKDEAWMQETAARFLDTCCERRAADADALAPAAAPNGADANKTPA